MKNVKMIFRLALLTIGLMTFSCSVDSEIDTNEINELNIQADVTNQTRAVELRSLMIEWHEGVSKDRKKEVREFYITNDILHYYEPCSVKPFETWYIDCEKAQCRNTDTPVDTDDDVKRAKYDIECEDL